jgi:NitT/TauT family transport system substrate-binding protein
MKSIRLSTMTALALLGLLSAATPVRAQSPLPPVRLAEVVRTLFFGPVYVAVNKGFFDEEGIKLASFKTTPGNQANLTEMISGGSDIGLNGPEAAAYTMDAGTDKRLVNFAALTGTDGTFIVAKTAINSFDLRALKGKTIVTSGPGSTPALVLEHLVRKAGLDPKKDVTIRNVPVTPNIAAAYKGADADFAQINEPPATLLLREGAGHRLASVGELLGPVPYTTFMAPADYIKKNPAVIQAFTNAIYKAQLWMAAGSADEVAAALLPSFPNVDPGLIKAVVEQYKRNTKAPVWAASPVITREGMDFMLDLVVHSGALKRKPAYEAVVDPSFAEKALRTIKR